MGVFSHLNKKRLRNEIWVSDSNLNKACGVWTIVEPVRDFDFSFLSAVGWRGLACDFGSNVDGHRFLAVFLAFGA